MNQWQMIAASVAGASHLHSGLPCQDVHEVRFLGNGAALVAVADGLGSAVCAERGAQTAVTEALRVLADQLTQSLPQDEMAWLDVLAMAFTQARLGLEELAAAEMRPLRDYATTLILAVVTDAWIGSGQIGDGAVVAVVPPGESETLSAPQRGEFANETMPLTMPDALRAVRYSCRPVQTQAIAIFTDGLQNLCLEASSNAPYQPFFAPLFAQIGRPIDQVEASQALIAFLQSERIGKRSDDDKTLVLIGRVGQ